MQKDRVILERRFVPKGSIIIREGDVGYSAYLIQSGTVSVYTEENGQAIELAQLGVGEICGEMALIGENERSANVKAIEDCNLIVLTRTSFEERMRGSDPAIRAMIHMLMGRIKTGNSNLVGRKSDISDLRETVQSLYAQVHASMNAKEQQKFENRVKDAFDEFLNAIDSFIK